MSEAIRSTAPTEQCSYLVQSLGTHTPEVPSHVGILCVGLGVTLLAVDKVGELDWVSDEEDGCVISDHVIDAIFCVEFDGESSWISIGICRSFLSSYSRETSEKRSLFANTLKEGSLGIPTQKSLNQMAEKK